MADISFMPRNISVGANQLLLTDEDFLNGYQAGHLAYMADGRKIRFTDVSLRQFMMTMLENMEFSEPYCFGYVMGWIVTFAGKEPKQQDNASALAQEES